MIARLHHAAGAIPWPTFRLADPVRPSPAVLILSSRHRLWQRYGPDGVFAIERALGELMAAMAGRGLAATLVYPDDSPLLAAYGVLPADTRRPGEMARVVRELGDRMRLTEEDVRHVLIIGDDGILPFDRPANPSPDDEGALWSDLVYGTEAGEPLRPARGVGRLPFSGLADLVHAIRTAAQAHQRLAAGAAPAGAEAFGYSASLWKRAARDVFSAIGDPRALRLSPPLTEREAPRPGPDGPRLRYFNLHGLQDSPAWFGELDPAFPAAYDACPVALRPEDLGPAPGSVYFSAACFGAHVQGRGPRDSIALTALAGGSLGFVGATGVAYGGLEGALVAGDLLSAHFWREVLAGAPLGLALASAKRSMVQETLLRQGYLDAEDEKAVLNFVLYGDPSLVCLPPSRRAEDAAGGGPGPGSVEWVGQAPPVGAAPARPQFRWLRRASKGAAPADGAPGPLSAAGPSRASATRQLASHVQALVARRLPSFAGAEVRVESSSAPRRSLAKGPAGGWEAEGECCPLVITLKKSVPTSGGADCHEVVRVTVDARGDIRKLTLSH